MEKPEPCECRAESLAFYERRVTIVAMRLGRRLSNAIARRRTEWADLLHALAISAAAAMDQVISGVSEPRGWSAGPSSSVASPACASGHTER